jgi:hypothetical protein
MTGLAVSTVEAEGRSRLVLSLDKSVRLKPGRESLLSAFWMKVVLL